MRCDAWVRSELRKSKKAKARFRSLGAQLALQCKLLIEAHYLRRAVTREVFGASMPLYHAC
jgi:hypothetical protein